MMPTCLPCRVALCAATIFLLAACESRPDRHEMIEEARHAVPPMAASETFFDGAVVAHLTLGSDPGAGVGSDREGDKGGGHPGHSGGGGRHGGGYGRGGRTSSESGGSEGAAPATMHASAMPPALLRLENTTAAVLEVEVRDLNSELGDFAVRPDKLTLPPGQSDEPDPMESLLGVDTYSLPVTLTLRAAGRTETKVLTLQLLKPALDAK